MSSYLSDRDRRLMHFFPELFGSGPWNPQTSGMAWGLMVGNGWRPLVLDLLEELAAIRREERLDHLQIMQIKEKYGGLRVYVSPHTDSVDAAIARAEARAARTCETCGRPGELRTDQPYLQTLCDACAAARG